MNSPDASRFRLVIFICLFFSGLTSLVYELVWIRQLTLVIGGTLYAVSAALCAFMGGLGAGAWGVSKFLAERESWLNRLGPVKAYGALEGLIGLYALAFPYALEGLSGLYPWFLEVSQGSEKALRFCEFGMSVVLLAPATCLMGASLPLIGSWAVEDRADSLLSQVSLLYGLNTFGAVAGCLFAQFVGIKYFGVQGATYLAVALNLLIFATCFCLPVLNRAATTPLPGYAKPLDDLEGEGEAGGRLQILLLGLFAFSGFVALASEILWTRILVFPLGSAIYSFALILAAFLFGIALGSLTANRIFGSSNLVVKFLALELAVGLYGLGILPAFDSLHDWIRQADRLFYDLENTASRTLAVRSVFAFGLMLLPTFGFGLLFPLANRIHLPLFKTVGQTLGKSYAANTLGSVLGALAAPFFLIPVFGIRGALFAINAILILLSALGLALFIKRKPLRRSIGFAFGILALLGVWFGSPLTVSTQEFGRGNFSRTEFNVKSDQLRLLDYKEGDFSTLSVVEDRATQARTLYVDGFSTATVSNSIGGSAYMQAMGFLPMALHPDPKRALTICFGTGNTMGAVTGFPGVQVDGVEIDRNVLSMAHWFKQWNREVLSQPNVRMFVQDGRRFIRWSKDTYDVITLEPMSPVQAGVNNLYSREFYELAAQRLADDGIMMQWLPLHLVGPEDARMIIKTFQSVFPHTTVWNSFLTRIVLLVGSRQPTPIDKNRFDQLMKYPQVAKMAREIGMYSFLDFMDFFIADGAALTGALEPIPIITDDRPFLEYSLTALVPPYTWQTDASFLNLLRHRAGRFPSLLNVSPREKESLKNGYQLRTAQRFAVFSRRYQGPGREFFEMKNYRAGMEEIRKSLEQAKGGWIQIQNGRWIQ